MCPSLMRTKQANSRFLSFGNSGKSRRRGFPASILVPQFRQHVAEEDEKRLTQPDDVVIVIAVVVDVDAVDDVEVEVAASRLDFGLQGRKGV